MTCKALVVDDDVPVLQTLKGVLETRDFKVRTESSARDGIRALQEDAFDLVVTDMRMETTTAGFEVVRNAKNQARCPIVVILTAYPIPANEWRKTGADALYMKGSGVGRMLDDLEKLVSKRHSSGQSAA